MFGKSVFTIKNKKFKIENLVDLLKINGFSVQFSHITKLVDFQTEFLELFMQQKCEIIIFSSNNLLELDNKIYWDIKN